MENKCKDLVDEVRDAYLLIQKERIIMVSKYVAEYFGHRKRELTGV